MTFRPKKIYCPKHDFNRGGKYVDATDCYNCLFCKDVTIDAVHCLYKKFPPRVIH